MDLQTVKDWIASGAIDSVESAWLEALAEKAPAADLAAAIEALSAAGRLDTASTLAWMLLEERTDLPAQELLEVGRRLVTAVPDNPELRARLAQLYRQVYAKTAGVDGLVKTAGLEGGQSPRRALRTLDLCLGLAEGAFLVSRFEPRTVRVKGFREVSGQFELVDDTGHPLSLEPKLLADEYEPVDPRDFRVLSHRPDDLRARLADDPAEVLIGMCLSRGGKIGANDIKEALVGHVLTAEDWSDWWGRARTAAKRSPNLTLEGRAPILVIYHPGGRTLEEELAGPREAARTPNDLHVLLQLYLREARGRKLQVKADFAAGILKRLAEQAKEYLHRRPLDALTAALAIELAARAELAVPEHPAPAEVLAASGKPAEAIAGLEDDALWSAGLQALAAGPDAPAHLRRLAYLVSSGRMDDIVSRLVAGAADEGLAQAVAEALAEPTKRLELFLWLWQGPATPPPGLPKRMELLSRLLKAMGDLTRQWDLTPARRKETWRRIRAAIAAADYASFRSAAGEMDEHVAATVKRQIERLEGLAQSVRENLAQILRERFPQLFFTREKVEPWEEEGTIWTSEAALHRQEAVYKELVEIKIPANARAIGAAAAHGDLSENSEWKFALEERDMLAARKMKMEEELANARVLHPADVPTDHVSIGSRVTLRRVSDNTELVMTFLGPWDADPDHGTYSYQTRMAQDLMGHKPGEELVLRIREEEDTWRIEAVRPAL